MSLPSLLTTYSVFWYGAFHLATRPPTENVAVYYLSLFHLILSFAYLLFIHPLNMLASSDVGNTNPTNCLKALRAQEGAVDEPNHVYKVNKQTFVKNLQDNKRSRLTKSGSFPAATSSRMRRKGQTKLDHKQGEVWPQSFGKEAAHGCKESTTKLMPLTLTSSKGKLPPIKRPSFLRESVDKYAQLYEFSSKKEIKRVSRRGSSLSELEYNSFLPNIGEYIIDNVALGRNRREENEMCNIQFLTEEDFELGLQSQSKSNLAKQKNEDIPQGGQFSPIELADEEYNSEFHYVKNVLELSGFTRKDEPCTWYSLEQPINPDLFEEIERHYCDLNLLQSSAESEVSSRVRELIFDLINEALVYIHEKPYLYYPKASSFKCHVHPTPKARHLVHEVWALVGRSLYWRPNADALLVAYDLNPNDGWMNLQIESERVALEVEDLILDELLNDVLLAC